MDRDEFQKVRLAIAAIIVAGFAAHDGRPYSAAPAGQATVSTALEWTDALLKECGVQPDAES